MEYYTSDKVPHWFLRLFGDDLIEEYTARSLTSVVAGAGLHMLAELECINNIDWDYLKFCATEHNEWSDIAPCVKIK